MGFTYDSNTKKMETTLAAEASSTSQTSEVATFGHFPAMPAIEVSKGRNLYTSDAKAKMIVTMDMVGC